MMGKSEAAGHAPQSARLLDEGGEFRMAVVQFQAHKIARYQNGYADCYGTLPISR